MEIKSEVKIFRMCDEDTVIAYSKEQAVEFYEGLVGEGCIEPEEICEIDVETSPEMVWWEVNLEDILDWVIDMGRVLVGWWGGNLSIEIPIKNAVGDYLKCDPIIPNIFSTTEI